MSEVVKIVFDIDTADVKSSTDELKALKKVTDDEIQSINKLGQSAEDAGDGFVSLRTRVKEAKEEAVKAAEKYGEFSKEANAARVKAGALADQMGDLNRQVNLLNPEAKAKAFSNLAQGVVGAFSIATGAVQAFGIKNKEVEQLAQKLQAALNITQGIASLGQLKEAYQDVKVVLGFTTVAQEALTAANVAEGASATGAAVATKGFTAALLTNPVFLAVAAIAALAGAMIAMGDDTEEAKTKVDLMTESQKALRQASNNAADAADRLAVAQGKLSNAGAQVNKAYRDNATNVADLNEQIAVNNGQIKDNNKIIEKNRYDLDRYNEAIKKNKEAVEKGWKTQTEANKSSLSYLSEGGRAALAAVEANQKLVQSNKEITETIKQKNKATNETVEAIKAEDATQQAEKRKQDAKEAASQAKQNAKEREQQAKEQLRLADELKKKLQENTLAEISDNEERIKMAKKFADENYATDLERLQSDGATQDAIDLRAAEHTATIKKLDDELVNSNKSKNDKIRAAEKTLQDALLNLALSKELDPIKQAQIINDAKEKEIDDKLKLVEKGSIEEQALLAEKEKAEIDAAKRIADAQIKANKEANAQKEADDKLSAQKRKEAAEGAVNALQAIVQWTGEANAKARDEELAQLEKQKEQKIISEEEYQKRLKVIKQKQAEDAKKQAIYNATLDLSRAIIAALTVPPPASAVAATFAAGLAGLNLAKIIATPIPKFAKGTLSVPGTEVGKDSVHAMLMPGEAVIPTATNRAYHPTIKAIYEKKISASEINSFVLSRTKGGNVASKVTASVDSYELGRVLSRNKGVQIENANLVGKAIAREIGRAHV